MSGTVGGNKRSADMLRIRVRNTGLEHGLSSLLQRDDLSKKSGVTTDG